VIDAANGRQHATGRSHFPAGHDEHARRERRDEQRLQPVVGRDLKPGDPGVDTAEEQKERCPGEGKRGKDQRADLDGAPGHAVGWYRKRHK
jgi:hypothetical protein